MEIWSSLVKATPLSRCTSKRHKKEEERGNNINHGSETTTTTSYTCHPTTTLRPQRGEGINTVIAGIPKVGWKITKGLEKLAKKNAKKAHLKRMAEIQKGKRKRYAGESFTCNLM